LKNPIKKIPSKAKSTQSLSFESQIESMNAQEEEQLIRSLKDAMNDVDAGRYVSMRDAHKLVASWVQK
jgi:hypothetical protein